jgi:hypothetical protein
VPPGYERGAKLRLYISLHPVLDITYQSASSLAAPSASVKELIGLVFKTNDACLIELLTAVLGCPNEPTSTSSEIENAGRLPPI